MDVSPTRRGKRDTHAYYHDRARQPRISYEDVMSCAVPCPDKKCTSCDAVATQSNRSYCASCAGYWIPKPDEHGSALLGPEFMYSAVQPYNKTKCACGHRLCREIGYSQRGRFSLPEDAKERQVWLDVLGLKVKATDATHRLNQAQSGVHLAWWHFPPDRRKFDEEKNRWELIGRTQPFQFRDGSRTKYFDFLVPMYPLQEAIDEIRARRRQRGRDSSALERRELDVSALAAGAAQDARQRAVPPGGGKPVAAAPARKRRHSEGEDLVRANRQKKRADAAVGDLEEARGREEAMLAAANVRSFEEMLKQLDELKKTFDADSIAGAVAKSKLQRGDAATKAEQASPGSGLKPIRYNDCADEDINAFTYHGNREEFDAFCDMINVKRDGPDGEEDPTDPGECSRLSHFVSAKKKERRGGEKRKRKKGGGRKAKLHWKDEYLCWSCYVHCGWTEKQTARLFGIGQSTVSSIVRTWSVYLDQCFAYFFPNPTKPELLRCYPRHFVRMLGHARCGMNLDATDIEGESSRFADSQSVSFSAYHHQTGAKALAGCTPIGLVPYPWVSKLYPSGISDEAMTEKTGILGNLRPHDAINVDRGFCIENQAMEGHQVQVIRPQKKMRGQTQFSAADASRQHKVGTTRSCIEECNSHAKGGCRYLQRVTPATQFDLLGAIVRISFGMTNFMAPVTVGVHSGSTGNRPCRAGVVYLGHEEEETIDARAQPELWCTKTQYELHRRLSGVLCGGGSDVDAVLVSELVLAETSLEGSATSEEKAAQAKWVKWKETNADWKTNQRKQKGLRKLAMETLKAYDAARKADLRLGIFA